MVLGEGLLVRPAGAEELNLLALTCGGPTVLGVHVVEGDLLGTLAWCEEGWEVVLVLEGRSA